MNLEMRQRLALLLKQLRGDRSQRQYAPELCRELQLLGASAISYSALRGYEESQAEPGVEFLEVVARLRGWDLSRLMAYLRGNERVESQPVSVEGMKQQIQGLSLVEKGEILAWLADHVQPELRALTKIPVVMEGEASRRRRRA